MDNTPLTKEDLDRFRKAFTEKEWLMSLAMEAVGFVMNDIIRRKARYQPELLSQKKLRELRKKAPFLFGYPFTDSDSNFIASLFFQQLAIAVRNGERPYSLTCSDRRDCGHTLNFEVDFSSDIDLLSVLSYFL